nr:MAG TPA: hypothetical protein [Bacteriophage sp.]
MISFMLRIAWESSPFLLTKVKFLGKTKNFPRKILSVSTKPLPLYS